MTRILLVSGSAREGSFNKRLLALAAAQIAATGSTVDTLDLAAFDLPIVDENIVPEPAAVDRVRTALAGADGLVISSPEYNHSITPLLKNAIDWVSHPMDRQPFPGKPILLMSASARPWGGTRMLPHLRDVLVDLGAVVLPTTVAVPSAPKAFNADGTLVEPLTAAYMERAVAAFLREVERHVRPIVASSAAA